MELSFIQELTEARLFKYRDRIQDKTVQELAKTYYLMMIVLHIMRYEDFHWAKEYVNKTLQYNDFTGFRMSATDLHNLMVVLSNQGDFEFKTGSEADISLPLLGIKRFMRDIQYHRQEHYILDNHLFLDLEAALQLHDSQLRAMRRMVMYWHTSTKQQRKTMAQKIYHQLYQLGPTNDMIQAFRKALHV